MFLISREMGNLRIYNIILTPTLLSVLVASSLINKDCPCKRPSLCKPVDATHDKEVFVFSIGGEDWAHYDWSLITTVTMFGDYDPGLMCRAHEAGARVVLKGIPPVSVLPNPGARRVWITKMLQLAKDQYMDGINIATEDALNKSESGFLTRLVQETRDAFHKAFPHSQVSFDVAWSADCIDGRCYDYAGLANACDLIYVISYDEQDQILKGPCIAKANAPYIRTQQGVQTFIDLGIPPRKMVLGVPWYGYDYPCIDLSRDDECTIPFHPYHGARCSDTAGSGECYSSIMALIKSQGITPKWNDTYKAPYFTFKDSAQKNHQMWYDNPRSLAYRYSYAKSIGMLGVGMWKADCLDYSPAGMVQSQEMWDAITHFLH